jgi:hypothetical protein
VIGFGAAVIVGGLLFIVSLFPAPAPSELKRPAAPAASGAGQPAEQKKVTPAQSAPQDSIEAGANPIAFEVAFYTPQAPLTVNEATRLRSLPSADSRALGTLLPGVRLRVNGRVEATSGGPWLRHRLNSGGVGYVAENMTSDLAAWQRRRNAERAAEKSATEAPNAESGSAVEGESAPPAPAAEQPATPF